jgi:hypothetical protein
VPDSPQPLWLAGDFADDGVSGAIPVRDRPEGQRLLEWCRAGAVKLSSSPSWIGWVGPHACCSMPTTSRGGAARIGWVSLAAPMADS